MIIYGCFTLISGCEIGNRFSASLKTILDSVDNIAKDAFRILKEEMWINKVNIPK